jgi:hypothetical protein
VLASLRDPARARRVEQERAAAQRTLELCTGIPLALAVSR